MSDNCRVAGKAGAVLDSGRKKRRVGFSRNSNRPAAQKSSAPVVQRTRTESYYLSRRGFESHRARHRAEMYTIRQGQRIARWSGPLAPSRFGSLTRAGAPLGSRHLRRPSRAALDPAQVPTRNRRRVFDRSGVWGALTSREVNNSLRTLIGVTRHRGSLHADSLAGGCVRGNARASSNGATTHRAVVHQFERGSFSTPRGAHVIATRRGRPARTDRREQAANPPLPPRCPSRQANRVGC
jgi:hypothetical protein